MKQFFLALRGHLTEQLPQIQCLDEDFGQLDNEEGVYEVGFPCLLFTSPQTEWDTFTRQTQRGKCTLTLRLAMDCADPGDNTTAAARMAARLHLATEVQNALTGKKLTTNTGMLVLRNSRTLSLPGNIKVYEADYETTVAPEVAD